MAFPADSRYWSIRGVARALRLALALASLGIAVAPAVHAADGPDWLGRHMPYGAFETLPATRIEVGESILDIAFAPGETGLPKAEILAWIAHCARAVARYYGRFPVDQTRLLVVTAHGSGVLRGTAFASRGAAIRVVLGDRLTAAQLREDWILVHEMIHLAFPEPLGEHAWIEEGLATYLEPIVRAQAGDVSADYVWRRLLEKLPLGQPETGDRGLDRTPTWGRTYWGGALYCLLADVEIRRRTANRFGLRDALRAILARTGGMEASAPLDEVFASGDAAVGVPVLSELYQRHRTAAVAVDLPALWKELGVVAGKGGVRFDDQAPLAAIRRAITSADQ